MKKNVVEDEEEKISRYMNGLKVPIQEVLSLYTPKLVNKCYQLAIKVDEKYKRKKDYKKRQRK